MEFVRLLATYLLLLIACTGCGLLTEDGPRRIGLALEQGFKDDWVEVEVDGQRVFADTVRTEDSVGLAARADFALEEGRHRIQVRVNERVEAQRAFGIRGLVDIAVSYRRDDDDIEFEFRDYIMGYD